MESLQGSSLHAAKPGAVAAVVQEVGSFDTAILTKLSRVLMLTVVAIVLFVINRQ